MDTLGKYVDVVSLTPWEGTDRGGKRAPIFHRLAERGTTALSQMVVEGPYIFISVFFFFNKYYLDRRYPEIH